MNLIFKVQNENMSNIPPYCRSSICKISSKNTIAFSVVNEINPGDNFCLQNKVFVCDLLSPWNVYGVCSTEFFVQILEWNLTGEIILIAESGSIKLWRCKDQVLNSWKLAYIVNVHCERIINCRFFHNGKKVNFNTLKRDIPIYSEKFDRVKHSASLVKFGKVAAEGCIIITTSGLLSVFFIPNINFKIIKQDSSFDHIELELKAVTHSLGLVRNYIECCTIAYCNNGSFRIATHGSQEKLVHCFDINVKFLSEGNLIVNRKSFPSIFLSGGYQTHMENFKISRMKWIVKENEELILIAYNYEHTCIVEQWNLISNNKSIHKFLQKNKLDTIQCECWENMARYHLSAQLKDMCISKNMFDNQLIYLLLKDNSIQILESGLKKIGVLNMTKFLEERQQYVSYIAFDISIMNHVLILLNSNGDMYAVQVCSRYIEMKPSEILAQEVSLLEYCIISGFDASDILLLHISNLESLIEKLSDNFMRQPPFIRQYYYSNFLALKSNMCRMLSKQNDFDDLIILHSISIAFKSLLRPSDLATHDKSPADNLSIVLSDPLPDVDKVLFNLDAKDFTVEPLTLQSLQQLIQWVADLALNILNKLPEDISKNKFCKKQCYEISKDSVALNNIRELLAMIRIWGLLNSQCLPIYTKSTENIDVLAVLFRLLTRLSQNPSEPDELLLDECIILSTQILVSNYNTFSNVTLLSGNIMQMKSFPLLFTSFIEPIDYMQEIQFERVMFSGAIKDGACNIHLGKTAHQLKECIRCGFFNECNNMTKTSALKAWCHRWINCRCGGFWRNTN